jgi:PPE-repeat protein
MNFSLLPPEVHSARMFAGAGSKPMVRAAAAWGVLTRELVRMSAATHSEWLGGAAAQAGGAAAHVKEAVAVYENARAATAHPLEVWANRTELVSLVRSNFLGFNAPAIAAIEGDYERMWIQNAVAMAGYYRGTEFVR